MKNIVAALADPVIWGWYVGFCFALLVLPMIALSYWYHSNIHGTEGGRRLMQRQSRSQRLFHRRPGHERALIGEAVGMAGDISRGRYGMVARIMQNRVYWVVGFWLLANVIAFGILIWADEANRGTG